MTGLDVRNLTVRYGERVAVNNVNLTVAEGQSLALVGASGSGKSSLLLAIAGVIEAIGTVSWAGVDVSGTPAHRRGFGLVFQDGQLFPHLTVERNVAFGLEAQGMPKGARRDRVDELLNLVGLAGSEDRRVTELSGGERQRIALARTLAPRPRLVLLDEPLSSLDADLRSRIGRDLRLSLESSGASWIVVTHDLAEAQSMADEVATMCDGELSHGSTSAQQAQAMP